MTTDIFKGIIAYTVTPFSSDTGEINIDALYTLIDNLIAADADVIAALGSAGEGAYLEDDEWALVAKKTIEYVNKRVPVIVGISELTTSKAISRAVFADQLGADAIMVSPFSYYRLSEDEIYDHYAAIAAEIAIPIMIYNNPATCGVDMSPAFMLTMIDGIDNVTMIKESTGDIQRMWTLSRLSKGAVPFFNGCNYIALDALTAGARGWCTVAPCLIDDLPKRLFDAIKQDDLDKAKGLFEKQLPLLEFIVNGGLAATVKTGLAMKGLDVGMARRPLKPLTSDKKQLLEDIVQAVGI